MYTVIDINTKIPIVTKDTENTIKTAQDVSNECNGYYSAEDVEFIQGTKQPIIPTDYNDNLIIPIRFLDDGATIQYTTPSGVFTIKDPIHPTTFLPERMRKLLINRSNNNNNNKLHTYYFVYWGDKDQTQLLRSVSEKFCFYFKREGSMLHLHHPDLTASDGIEHIYILDLRSMVQKYIPKREPLLFHGPTVYATIKGFQQIRDEEEHNEVRSMRHICSEYQIIRFYIHLAKMLDTHFHEVVNHEKYHGVAAYTERLYRNTCLQKHNIIIKGSRKMKFLQPTIGGKVNTEMPPATIGLLILMDFPSFYPNIVREENIDPLNLPVLPDLMKQLLTDRAKLKIMGYTVEANAKKFFANGFIGMFAFTGSNLYFPETNKRVTQTGQRVLNEVIQHTKHPPNDHTAAALYNVKPINWTTDSLLVNLVNCATIKNPERAIKQVSEMYNIFLKWKKKYKYLTLDMKGTYKAVFCSATNNIVRLPMKYNKKNKVLLVQYNKLECVGMKHNYVTFPCAYRKISNLIVQTIVQMACGKNADEKAKDAECMMDGIGRILKVAIRKAISGEGVHDLYRFFSFNKNGCEFIINEDGNSIKFLNPIDTKGIQKQLAHLVNTNKDAIDEIVLGYEGMVRDYTRQLYKQFCEVADTDDEIEVMDQEDVIMLPMKNEKKRVRAVKPLYIRVPLTKNKRKRKKKKKNKRKITSINTFEMFQSFEYIS